MRKNNNLKKLKMNQTTIVVVVVVVLILVGVWCLAQKNGFMKNNRENFYSEPAELNRIDNKINPKDDEVFLVIFYVDWCPHCVSTKPEWAKLQNNLNNKKVNGKNVQVKAVNCEGSKLEEEAAKDNNVNGFPTIKLIKNNESIDYNGERNAEAMVEFVNQNA